MEPAEIAATTKHDKETLTNQEPSDKKPSSVTGNISGDTPVTQKDFYWDQILFYLVSAILGLSFLDVSIEFFRDSSIIKCYIFDTTITRDQVAYLNNYCYSSLPNSQYYLIFILISALIIIAPHYLWMSYFGAYFDFFFDLAKKLHCLQDTKTGEYNPYNFELVKKLEQKFSSSNPWMFRCYKLKLLAQLGVCLIVETVNAFYFEADDFNESFLCPTDTGLLNTTVWPIPEQLNCVYNSLTLLYFLRNTALGLVAAAIVVIMIGLVWCFLPHTTELGAKDIAAFCNVFCLPPEEYTLPSIWKVVILPCAKRNQIQDVRVRHQVSQGEIQVQSTFMVKKKKLDSLLNKLKPAFSPRIHTDLDFLVTRLFYADSGHGQVFKEIQIIKELDYRSIQDHKFLHLLNLVYEQYKKGMSNGPVKENNFLEQFDNVQEYFFKAKSNIEQSLYSLFKDEIGADKKNWPDDAFTNELFYFFQMAPDNNFALDISFGNRRGHSLILARAFKDSVTIHFNKYYKNFEEVCHSDDYETNYHILTLQNDIYGQNADSNTKSDIPIVQFLKSGKSATTIDLIVVGPITEYSDIVTTNILLEKIHAPKYITKKAILLAIRPLKIGFEQRSEHFIQYKPPQGIFKVQSPEEVFPVECNNVQCIYEFKIYSYTGSTEKEQVPQ